jgi:hypothetical protein
VTAPTDPRERLRRANPVTEGQAPRADSPQARALFERIVDTPPESPVARRLKGRRLWILLPAVLLLAGAATYAILRPVTEPISIACYQGPDLNANRAIVPSNIDEPVAACGPMWRPGGEFNQAGTISPPPLTVCVLDGGALGVFPSLPQADTCSVLGLAHPDDQTGATVNRSLINLYNGLAARFLNECVGRERAILLARAELARTGLSEWRVVLPLPFTDAEPCASLALDIPNHVVRLIPVHRTIP